MNNYPIGFDPKDLEDGSTLIPFGELLTEHGDCEWCHRKDVDLFKGQCETCYNSDPEFYD